MLSITFSLTLTIKKDIPTNEVRRLANQTNEMEKANHEPRKVENIFQKDSCNFEPGSTLNGDVLKQ